MVRVRFPSDNMTKAQKKKMSGAVRVYHMNDPISWDEFRSYPESIQKEYLNNIIMRYNATQELVAGMFGISVPTLHRAGFSGVFSRKRPRMTEKQKEKWNEFLSGEKSGICEDAKQDESSDGLGDNPIATINQIAASYAGNFSIDAILKDFESMLKGREVKSFNITAVFS